MIVPEKAGAEALITAVQADGNIGSSPDNKFRACHYHSKNSFPNLIRLIRKS